MSTPEIALDLPTFLASYQEQLPGPEDLSAWCLPLLEQAARLHEQHRAAPLQGIAAVQFSHGQFWFDEGSAAPVRRHDAALLKADPPARGVLIAGRQQTGDAGHFNLQVQAHDAAVTAPCYRSGYLAWEHALDHHDPLSDIFVLGLVLASCALGKDLSSVENLREFADHRENLLALNPQLHPVFARVIAQMTDLSRHTRLPDLHGAIRQLRDYREQDVSRLSLGSVLAETGAPQSRRLRVQTHLRDRLFDLSRRNRLLHFKSSQQALNLTIGSFPYLLDPANVKADNLLFWHPQIAEKLSNEQPLPLARYIRFEDAPYLIPQLEDLRASARRDAAEYGFSPLRLVIAWLSWTNLKEGQERIVSPLVLLPVALEKVKAVRDAWVLKPQSSTAEVNPALRHALKKIYGIELPESVDLPSTPLHSLHAQLAEVIAASEPGVQLKLIDKPRIQLIKRLADMRLEQHRRRLSRSGAKRARGSYADLPYSYQRDSYQPLGLKLFDRYARPVAAPLSDLLETTPRERTLDAASAHPSPAPTPRWT